MNTLNETKKKLLLQPPHFAHWLIASLWNAPKNLQCKQINKRKWHSHRFVCKIEHFFSSLPNGETNLITGNQIDAKYSLYAFNFFFLLCCYNIELILLFSISFLGRLWFVYQLNHDSPFSKKSHAIVCPCTHAYAAERRRHRMRRANDSTFNGCNFIWILIRLRT